MIGTDLGWFCCSRLLEVDLGNEVVANSGRYNAIKRFLLDKTK